MAVFAKGLSHWQGHAVFLCRPFAELFAATFAEGVAATYAGTLCRDLVSGPWLLT